MLIVLLLLVIAFFGSAIIYGLIEGAKEGFGMTNEEAKQILRQSDKEQEEQKERQRKKEFKKRYKRRYNYWYNKSYDVIDGCAAQTASKRDAYARRRASKDIYGI